MATYTRFNITIINALKLFMLNFNNNVVDSRLRFDRVDPNYNEQITESQIQSRLTTGFDSNWIEYYANTVPAIDNYTASYEQHIIDIYVKKINDYRHFDFVNRLSSLLSTDVFNISETDITDSLILGGFNLFQIEESTRIIEYSSGDYYCYRLYRKYIDSNSIYGYKNATIYLPLVYQTIYFLNNIRSDISIILPDNIPVDIKNIYRQPIDIYLQIQTISGTYIQIKQFSGNTTLELHSLASQGTATLIQQRVSVNVNSNTNMWQVYAAYPITELP